MSSTSRGPKRTNAPSGFTLVELCVVVLVVTILAALLFPALRHAVEQAKRLCCASNLKQTGVALIGLAGDSRGRVPYINPPHLSGGGNHNCHPYSWDDATLVTPLMGYGWVREFAVCPSTNGEGSYDGSQIPGVLMTAGNHANDWISGYCYWAGFDEYTDIGVWFEAELPISGVRIHAKKSGLKMLVTDWNMWADDKAFAYVNHSESGRHAYLLGEAPTVGVLTHDIAGGNRLFNDGHVKWAKPSEMGRDGGAIQPTTGSCRYSHWGTTHRPYWF